jgi:hypothetical protein
MSIATTVPLEIAPAGWIALADCCSTPNLDVQYLGSVGPEAQLVLEIRRKQVPALLRTIDIRFPDARDLFARSENWRAWSFRTWRIKRYLANNPDTPSNLSNSDKG